MQLCFATNNIHKIKEVAHLLPSSFDVVSLEQIGCREELPETQPTIEGNSLQKAQYIWENYRISCFADDTGLEVDALHGEPGVYSARYAGPARNSEENINRLLQKLETETNRAAQFKTIITLIWQGETYPFEGIVRGTILWERRGVGGFGYDAVFLPDGYDQTFAEMSLAEKGQISHRGRAVEKLVQFLAKRLPPS